MTESIYLKTATVVERDGQILLIKEKVDASSPYRWNLIKGTYEIADRKVTVAALRECLEEVGLAVDLKGVLNIMFINTESGRLKIQCNFLAEPKEGSEAALPERDEQKSRGEDIAEFRWFKREDILAIPVEDFVSQYIYKVIRQRYEGSVYPLEVLDLG